MNPIPLASRHVKKVLAAGLACVLAVIGVALSTPSPIAITVIATRSTG